MKTLQEMQELQQARMGIDKGLVHNELEESIFADFEYNPAYQIAKLNGEEEIEIHFLIKSRQYGEPEIFCISRPETPIDVGDYVEDIYGNTWICYTYDDYPIRKNFLAQCNNILTWKVGNEIIEIPCILHDKTSVYSDGLHRNRRIMLADDQILITIPDKGHNSNICYGQRFMFRKDQHQIYKVLRIDKLPRPNLIDIKLRHDEYDKFRDNLELGLADYYTKQENDGDAESSKEDKQDTQIVIGGYDDIMLGTTEPYDIEVYRDGVLVDEEARCELINADGLAEISRFRNNICEIKANDKKKKGTFRLKITLLSDESISSEMDISIVAW